MGLVVSLAIGGVLVGVWVKYSQNLWPNAEKLWEASFSLVAAFFLTAMSLAFLKYDSMAQKWRKKLSEAVGDRLGASNASNAVDDEQDGDEDQRISTYGTVAGGTGRNEREEEERGLGRMSVHSDAPLLYRNRNGESIERGRAEGKPGFLAQWKGWWSLNASRRSGEIERYGGSGRHCGRRRDIDATSGEEMVGKSLNGMFLIPFVTVLREGLEGVVFLAGIAISEPLSSIPLSGLSGLLLGLLVGFVIYQAGTYLGHEAPPTSPPELHPSQSSDSLDPFIPKTVVVEKKKQSPLHAFFVASSVMLLMLASGLVVRAVRGYEVDWWVRKIGGADDPDALDSYHVKSALWHFNCCNPNTPGGWAILKSVIGWDNTGTYLSVSSYMAFWLVLSLYLYSKKTVRRSVLREKLSNPNLHNPHNRRCSRSPSRRLSSWVSARNSFSRASFSSTRRWEEDVLGIASNSSLGDDDENRECEEGCEGENLESVREGEEHEHEHEHERVQGQQVGVEGGEGTMSTR
ncbi:high-affinity iron permease [Phlyctochytrium planicorne]|nr:high-affinity iron permease [Phlyctochytrium planicorne]